MTISQPLNRSDARQRQPRPAISVRHLFRFLLLAACMLFLSAGSAAAETVAYHLTIRQAMLNLTGRQRPAMTINGGIPGPTLRFREGDQAIIHVHNRMETDTSIHWHGILLPNDQDGVPYLTYPPIKPGETFTYRFPIIHAGTYWYHSHSGLQEQQGVYGSIAIEPLQDPYGGIGDRVILFSDWSDEDPHAIMRTLKRGSPWYALKKGSAQSLYGAYQADAIGDFFIRELTRMPPMDIADVAYDRFLANGSPEADVDADPGRRIRLRLINGSSTTYFFLEFAGGPMTIISADGVDVQPFEEGRFLIAVAETYDALVTVPRDGSYELRATAHDGSGHASVWIGEGPRHPAGDVPRPDLYAVMGGVSLQSLTALTPAGSMGMPDRDVDAGMFDRPGMHMAGMHHDHAAHSPAQEDKAANHPAAHADAHTAHAGGMAGMGHGMDGSGAASPMAHGGASMAPTHGASPGGRETAVDGMDPRRPWPDYSKLRATQPTAMDPAKPRREIRLTLDGDMRRYVWLFNNKALHEQDKILVRKGEVARFILINRTMMHHPMHLHGHFFRVLNGQGDYAPLKHTVNVAPMSTTVIEFDANETGDWFFHCHLLYHMHSGMARIVHYQDFQPAPEVAAIRSALLEDPWHGWATGAVMSHMTEGSLTLANTRIVLNADWEAGWQREAGTDYEIDLTGDYSINGFASVFGGAAFTDEEGLDHRGIFGGRYVLPLLVETTAWVDTNGGLRVTCGKELPLTDRLSVFAEVEYDTETEWQYQTGAMVVINKTISLIGTYHSEFGAGAGLSFAF